MDSGRPRGLQGAKPRKRRRASSDHTPLLDAPRASGAAAAAAPELLHPVLAKLRSRGSSARPGDENERIVLKVSHLWRCAESVAVEQPALAATYLYARALLRRCRARARTTPPSRPSG